MTNEEIIKKYWSKIDLDLHPNQINVIKEMLNVARLIPKEEIKIANKQEVYKNQQAHTCLIAVDENCRPILLKSDPNLYENGVFDGHDLLDNITHNRHFIPKEFGIYKCKIMVETFNYKTDSGVEYDINTWLEEFIKIEILNGKY